MLRFAVYHWLPLAENMLPDIEASLRTKQNEDRSVLDINLSSDSIIYTVKFKSKWDNHSIRGKINRRGFAQHTLDFSPVPGAGLSKILEEVVPEEIVFVAEHIFDIVPLSVRNKIAVLNEGIRSFQEFESKKFEPYIDIPAKQFLNSYFVASILLDGQYPEYHQAIVNGIHIEALNLSINKFEGTGLTHVGEKGQYFLFFSTNFSNDEKMPLDSIIYKYCSLLIFDRFISHVIGILKQTRDHVIPLRRELVLKLQRNTEDHFEWLTRLKKYLTYVNVKLPVIQKALNHLGSAYDSDQFRAKLDTFKDASKIAEYPSLAELPSKYRPLLIKERIIENFGRLLPLYKEDTEEIKILSVELYQVLEGSLLSESAQVHARELDAAQISLELDRGGKNRANALKVLSVVLVANLGALIAELINASLLPTLGIILGTLFVAGIFIEAYLKSKAHYFRLLVPFNVTVPRESLRNLQKNRKLKTEINGTRRTYTWKQKLKVPNASFLKRLLNVSTVFLLTIDHETRGYVYSVTLEAESSNIEYNELELVTRLVDLMDSLGVVMLEPFSSKPLEDSSLLAEVLFSLDISLDDKLIALNRVLTSDSEQLSVELAEFINNPDYLKTLSDEDCKFYRELSERADDYVSWLLKALTDQNRSRQRLLLGERNLRKKYDMMRKVDRGIG